MPPTKTAESREVTALDYAVWLIKNCCYEPNATEAKITVDGFSHKGEIIGNYEVIIKKL